MERVRRRFWTWAVSGVALVVITGAMISGLFQLLVLALPSYREDLSGWVTEVAGRPVQIGGVSLVWRGFAPHLDLSDITLFTPDGKQALSAERLSLGFSLLRLVRGTAFPNQVALSGLSLAVNVDEHGAISVAGFDALQEASTPRPRQEWLREIARFKRVRLENCELRVTVAHLGSEPLNLTLLHADVDSTGNGFEADGELRLPAEYGEVASFSAEIDGDIAQDNGWTGEFGVEAAGLVPQAWLGHWLEPTARIEASELNLRLEGELRGGALAGATATLESGALLALRGGRSVAAESARLVARAAQAGEGWQFEVEELRFEDEAQARGSLRLLRHAGTTELDADAEQVRLTRLAPWLALWREAPEALLAASRLGGEARAVVVRLRQGESGSNYSVRATLQDVSLRADRHVGFSGLSGELFANEAGGRLQLSGAPVKLQLPSAIKGDVPFETLTGITEWRRLADAWQVAMPGFGWRLAGTQGSGGLRLLLPDDRERSPELNLTAGFSAEDVAAVKAFIPLVWGEGLRSWLERAIERGRVPRAQLSIRGPLADFPFDRRRSGAWSLDIDAADVRLAYLPDWPAVDRISAHLHFEGNSLRIESDGADVLGNKAERVVAEFRDFRDALLTIDARVSGEMARYYQFLKASPLKRTLAGLVNHTSAAGPAQLQLKLAIPLHEAQDTAVDGTVTLDGVELSYMGLDQPVSAISGQLQFDQRGVVAESLRAQFADLPLQAHIDARPGTAGVVVARFPFEVNVAGEGASAYVPAFLRAQLQGRSDWQAELPLGVADAALVLSSDLVGTAVRLPVPIGKPAAEAAPIRVAIRGDAQAPVRVRVGYAGRLGADVALRSREGEGWSAQAVSLRLGDENAAPAEGEGIRLVGEAAEMDFAAWAGALRGGGEDGASSLRSADLSVGRLLLGRNALGATRVLYAPNAGGWSAELSGPGAEGELRYENAAGGVLSARLDHAALEIEGMVEMPAAAPAAADGAAVPPPAPRPQSPPSDPARWPAFDVICDHLVVGGTDLGRLQLKASREGAGLRLEQLAISGGKLDASASGSWRRAEERSSGDLKFELGSSDVAAVLKAFKYAPNLVARSSRFVGEVAWSPAAGGIQWEQAAGRISLRIENGSLKAVEPGAGRVLGLINFYALPRRLTLDFRDVVNEGLAFDAISGSFDLANGAANTQDLKIDAPSLRMELRGRVGLVERDYDQRVTVYPDVSAGVTLGAALLGGPALGALVLLAQEVLDKPLDQATQLSYRLTGTWDNPKVERIGAEPRS